MKQRVSLFIFIFLVACASAPEIVSPVETLPSPQLVIETLTPSPAPTSTLTPSPTLTTEQWISTFTIDGLREHNFEGGEIKVRSTLDENDKYTTHLIEYPSDRLRITGVMQIPVGEGPFPVIIMNHGFFARSIYNSGDGTDRAAAYLAQQGYITIASDYRSWGGSEIGESFFYSGLVIDVINLIKAVQSIEKADPNRIGIWGHSMGGGVTMKVLTVLGGRVVSSNNEEGTLAPDAHRPGGSVPGSAGVETTIKAAVLYSTVSADMGDIINRWGMGCFGDIAQGELIVGCNSSDVIPNELPINLQDAYRFAANDADTLKEISPYYHLEDVTVPVQLHYGTEDGEFLSGTPPQWSVKLTQGLRDAGKEAEMYQYEGEGHSFIGQPWFDFMNRTVRFFDEHVKNDSR